jgi:hypothetical protein
MSFVNQQAVRCEDCETRADLTNVGTLADHDVSLGRVRACGGCGGRPVVIEVLDDEGHRKQMSIWGHVAPASSLDPYAAPPSSNDPYVRIRAERAQRGRISHAPRALRRRFFETTRAELLMSEGI